MPPLTPKQEARLEAEVYPLERAAYDCEQNDEREESLCLKRKALAEMEAIVGPVDESLADNFTLFAYGLRDDEQYAEAEPLLLRALSIYETLYGPSRLEVTGALYWLGCLYDDWERYDLSVPVWCRALAIEETICGKYSSEAQTTCVWLGDAFVQLSQYAQAEPYFKRAILIGRTRQALDDPWQLALTLERLAEMLFRLKRYGEALNAYEEVLALRKGKFRWPQSRRRYNFCRIRCTSGKE